MAAWVTYDLANTLFSMGIISLFLPMWLRDEMGADRVDAALGLVAAVSYGLAFLLAPPLGAATDRAGRRLPFLIASTALCVMCTVLLGRFGVAATLALFIVANIAYQSGLQFYDALLPDVSTPRTRGHVGGLGIGIGYVGSFLAVGLGLVVGTADKALLFLWIGLLFLLLALPCFFLIREPLRPQRGAVFGVSEIRASLMQTLRTLRGHREHPGLARFLVGRMLYTDAINTVIMVMALYTINVAAARGFEGADAERDAQLVMMAAIAFAVPGGIVWGRLVDRLGPKQVLEWVLGLWMAVFVLAAAIGLIALPMPWLYVVAILAGLALAGTWAADRPYLLRLAPPDRIGEFCGLYAMVGRFSAITGPAVWAGIFWLTVQAGGMAPLTGQAIGILLLGLQIVVGWLILRRTRLPEDLGWSAGSASTGRLRGDPS